MANRMSDTVFEWEGKRKWKQGWFHKYVSTNAKLENCIQKKKV